MNVNRVWLISGLVIILASFATVMWFWVLDAEPQVNRLVLNDDADAVTVAEQPEQICPATVVVETVEYGLCGHSTVRNKRGEAELVGLSYAELAAAGWRVAPQAGGKVELYRQEEGLCPADSVKRCICKVPGGIGVYCGTLAARGALLYELPMDLALLPEDWQQALAAGGFEFASDAELFRMLENLDEFVADTEEMPLTEPFSYGE